MLDHFADLVAVDTLTGLCPPLLALGTFERVGSNWLSDTLRRTGMPQHNEPLRQQMGAGHPLSTLNPDIHPAANIDAVTLDPYARYWLRAFVASKYGPVPHLVKETNLFGGWGLLLRLFPHSPVVVLSRSPLGIASSFARNSLYGRWRYPTRYRQLAAMTSRPAWQVWAPLMPDDDPDPLTALARMTALNAALLACALAGREHAHVAYEAAVSDRQLGARAVTALVPALHLHQPAEEPPGPAIAPVDDTFATTTPDRELVAYLTAAQAETVRSATAAALTTVRVIAPAAVANNAAGWLAGDHQYQLAAPRTRSPVRRRTRPAAKLVPARYVAAPDNPDLHVRNLLVTNNEFTEFLNVMAAAGLPNLVGGSYLLHVSSMPHERGGRIHWDPAAGRYAVSRGYEHHPVYWATWIGAAALATWQGARLPTMAEMTRLAGAGQPVTNADYQVGDVLPAVEHGRTADEVHHAVGNLQVWCADGPDLQLLAEQWVSGAAWNTPSSPGEITRRRSRHLTGASRGIGIRLFCDYPAGGMDEHRLATQLRAWLDALQDDTPLAEAERGLLAALRS